MLVKGFLMLPITAFLISSAAIWILRRMASQRGWVDAAGSDPLKIHKKPMPIVGGFGIILGCSVGLAVGGVSEFAPAVAFILVLGGAVAVLGFFDDVSYIRPQVRLKWELLLGIIVGCGGVALDLFDPSGLSLGRMMAIPSVITFVLFYVVGAINAINMQDGLDGLAGGIVLISCIGFSIVAAKGGHDLVFALALSLGGSLAAFLLYNFHPASVFMGDNGSYYLGFVVAMMALLLTLSGGSFWGVVGGILMVGVPVFDAAFAIARRLRRGGSPFVGDRSHFYDYIAQQGFSTRKVVLMSYVLQSCFVGAGAFLLLQQDPS